MLYVSHIFYLFLSTQLPATRALPPFLPTVHRTSLPCWFLRSCLWLFFISHFDLRGAIRFFPLHIFYTALPFFFFLSLRAIPLVLQVYNSKCLYSTTLLQCFFVNFVHYQTLHYVLYMCSLYLWICWKPGQFHWHKTNLAMAQWQCFLTIFRMVLDWLIYVTRTNKCSNTIKSEINSNSPLHSPPPCLLMVVSSPPLLLQLQYHHLLLLHEWSWRGIQTQCWSHLVLRGFFCDHNENWCDPGNNNSARCNKCYDLSCLTSGQNVWHLMLNKHSRYTSHLMH